MEISTEDQRIFLEVKEKIVNDQIIRVGIGTLQEKTVHAILKHYLIPFTEYHEVKVGKYIADIFFEGEIIEIQTSNFNLLRKKLEAFLPCYEVTIVYPIPDQKWLIWFDENTGELSNKRKSPKNGSKYDIFYQLYKIKAFLLDENLHFKIILMDMEEYRLLNGWSKDRKRGSSRYDRIPTNLKQEIYINNRKDYQYFLPDNLPIEFTTADFSKQAKISKKQAQIVIHILNYVGVIKKIGKKSSFILYGKNI